MKVMLLTIILIVLSSSVYAGCWYKDTLYPTGTVIGDMICGADGYWRPNK